MTMHTRKQLEKKLPKFRDWLASRGAQLLEPTNPFEVVRFKAGTVTAIVYAKGNGNLTYGGEAKKALDAFVSGHEWTAGVATKRKARRPADVTALLKRDGDTCFLCRKPLGDDITVEHLVALNQGGPDHIGNKALAHAHCNGCLGHRSVMEKIRMRESRCDE